MIREKLKAAQDRQKTYADLRRWLIEFEVGDKVFLMISPMKGVKRFGIKGKLALSTLDLMRCLRELVSDPSHVLPADVIDVEPNPTYEERPVLILERRKKKLRNKVVPFIQVLGRSQKFEQETWETESSMREKHPPLFE
ncbi:uncharacterized protein LOC141640263 [Silene latifolia]|uniref:uncharacterized protein LOC141640263 n=1 Tax=Silene latifolia TaxID=37657 RepID=UPI003D7706F2